MKASTQRGAKRAVEHVDPRDKQKPYGIAIYRIIDSFFPPRRYVFWLDGWRITAQTALEAAAPAA